MPVVVDVDPAGDLAKARPRPSGKSQAGQAAAREAQRLTTRQSWGFDRQVPDKPLATK